MRKKALFIASTGQNVGKTTTCLGLLAGWIKRHSRVGFMKPVGQKHVEIASNLQVDKDVVLFKEHFHLTSDYAEMSPVLIPQGFTRQYLDGLIDQKKLTEQIRVCFGKISRQNPYTIVEGTGHVGVGSIIDLNNAQVAALLKLPLILVASGGLGSTFDEIALNCSMCATYGVNLAGVIVNRVRDDKREMVLEYMPKALARWNIPLVGCIPYTSFLSNPSMEDFESLLEAPLLAGEEHRLRHFTKLRLVATSVDHYRDSFTANQLIITPADREDIILATLTKYWDSKLHSPEEDLQTGIILTGERPPRTALIEQIKRAHIPTLYTSLSNESAMKKISSFTAKISSEDISKVEKAIEVVERYIDFDKLEEIVSGSSS